MFDSGERQKRRQKKINRYVNSVLLDPPRLYIIKMIGSHTLWIRHAMSPYQVLNCKRWRKYEIPCTFRFFDCDSLVRPDFYGKTAICMDAIRTFPLTSLILQVPYGSRKIMATLVLRRSYTFHDFARDFSKYKAFTVAIGMTKSLVSTYLLARIRLSSFSSNITKVTLIQLVSVSL